MPKTSAVCLTILACLISVPTIAANIVTLNTTPWAIAKEQETGGVIADFAREISQRTGIAFSPRGLPASRLVQMINEGEADVALLNAVTPMEAETLGPVFVIPVVAVARPGVTLKQYEDLKSLRLGVVTGLNLGTPIDTDTNLNKSAEPNYDQIIRKMEAGRLDVTYGVAVSVRASAGSIGMAHVLGDAIPLQTVTIALRAGLKSTSADQRAALGKALTAMRDDGTIDQLRNKYFNADWSLK